MKDITAQEGIVASAYEDRFGEYDRLYQILKLYLFCPLSGLFSCPIAMTDGAAKTALVSLNLCIYIELFKLVKLISLSLFFLFN